MSFPTRQTNFLDLVFTNSLDISIVIETNESAVRSDHTALNCRLSISLPEMCKENPKCMQRTCGKYNWRKANFNLLKENLKNVPWNIMESCIDVNEKCDFFYEALEAAIDVAVPQLRVNPSKYPPWYDTETICALKTKNRLHRYWKRSQEPSSKEKFQIARKHFKQLQSKKYSEYMKKLDSSLSKDPKCVWRFIKRKTGVPRIPVEVELNGVKALDSSSSCQLFSDFFKTTFQEASTDDDPFPEEKNFVNENLQVFTVTAREVEMVLKNLVNGKSPGPDRIPVNVIKQCACELSVPLATIYNDAILSGTFPNRWNHAFVTPVLKKGNKHYVTNYRAISLLSIFSKVFEKLIYKRLYQHISNSIAPQQHGFVCRRSTVTNLLQYTHDLASAMNNKQQIDSIYTDFSKAFDSVDHRLLLKKLESFGISGRMHDLFHSYLNGRSQSVMINSQVSKSITVSSGVPQGSILGPLLFVVFVNDIPSCFHHSTSLLYADDLKLYRPIANSRDCELLQEDVDALDTWCQEWKLKLNVSKCNSITFTNKRKHVINYDYSIKNVKLERVNYIRDIGVILTSDLSYTKHISTITPKAFRLLGFIRRNFHSEFSPSIFKKLYLMLVRPQVDYASVVWNPHHITLNQHLEKIQRRFVRYNCWKTSTVYHGSNYEHLCQSIGIMTLEKRRLLTDLICFYKIINSTFDTELLQYINFRVPSRTLKNQNQFIPARSRIDIFKFSAMCRMQVEFNNFSAKLDTCMDFKTFKIMVSNQLKSVC